MMKLSSWKKLPPCPHLPGLGYFCMGSCQQCNTSIIIYIIIKWIIIATDLILIIILTIIIIIIDKNIIFINIVVNFHIIFNNIIFINIIIFNIITTIIWVTIENTNLKWKTSWQFTCWMPSKPENMILSKSMKKKMIFRCASICRTFSGHTLPHLALFDISIANVDFQHLFN